MRKTRAKKGITLIALIITIVVLLILAAVAISSITNDGILSYAQNAAKEYNQSVQNEQERLNQYTNFLQNKSNKNDEGTGNNLISFTIDGTTYYAEEGMKWGEWLEESTNFSYNLTPDGAIIGENGFSPLVISRFKQCHLCR